MVYYRENNPQWYTGGRGGRDDFEGGMMSNSTFALERKRLAKEKYESGVRAQKDGDPNAPSTYVLNEIKHVEDRDARTLANRGQTGQDFARPAFEIDAAMAELNEWRNQWGGKKAELSPRLQGLDRGQRMNSMSFGLASSGMGQGSSAGVDDGGGLPSGIRESSYTTNGGNTELISNLPGGQLQRWAQDPSGMLHAAGKVNSQFTAFSSPGQYRGQSTAGGFAGIPASQPQAPGMMAPQAPRVQQYGGAGANFYPNVGTPQGYGSGMSDVDAGPPYQMMGDRKFGRMENITEDGYGVTDGAPDDENFEPTEDALPHPDEIDKDGDGVPDGTESRDDWDYSEEGDDQDPRTTNQQIQEAVNNRAESQMTGNDTKDLEVEGERQRTLKALDDYSKRGFLPGYKPEDGAARPSELTAYGDAINGKERTKGIRRVGSPMVDAAESVESGAKQIFGRAQDGLKKVFQLSPPELSQDDRFENVRTNVRSDGKMSREEAQAAGEILDEGAQKSLDAFKLKQFLEGIQQLQSQALGEQNPRIALGEAFDKDFQSKTRHEFDPMEAGQIEAQMTGVKKSPRMDNDKRRVPMRPPTHREVLAQYLTRALAGGIA